MQNVAMPRAGKHTRCACYQPDGGLFNNTIGLDAAKGGALFTFGTNDVIGNTTNGAFTGTASLQ